MKKLLIASIIVISLLSSCAGECDTSTAEGAANCLCELTEEAELTIDTDKVKAQELSDKIIKIKTEIKDAIDAGNYTKKDVSKIAEDRSCMVTELLLPY